MPLRTEFIRQRELNDCGVACLAMAARVDYESARLVFDNLGLGEKSHRSAGTGQAISTDATCTDSSDRRPAYSSNFQELRAAMGFLGLQTTMRRFVGWDDVKGPAVIKVSNGHKTNWHWVYANRSAIGLYVLDPLRNLFSMDGEKALSTCLDILQYEPKGCFIEISC